MIFQNLKYNELIIPQFDFRYGKLGHLYKRYNYSNIIRRDERRILQYYIPGELLWEDYITDKIQLYKSDPDHKNWISNKYASRLIFWSTGLNPQEYFDLLVLHINNPNDRPRCVQCHCIVPWSNRIIWGYNQSVPWDKVRFTYCSNSHAKQFQCLHPEFFPEVRKHQEMFYEYMRPYRVRIERSKYLTRGNLDDEGYFYLARTHNNDLKIGVTCCSLECRSYQELMNSGYEYKSIHCILQSNRLEIANLEAHIKNKFGEEYLNWNNLHQVIIMIKGLLANRPIANPFE